MESQEKKYTEILARFILYAAVAGAGIFLAIKFSNVLIYILLAGVVSLIARPMKKSLVSISIKGHHIPHGLAAILSLIFIMLVFSLVILGLVPMARTVAQDVAAVTNEGSMGAISINLAQFNAFLIEKFDLDPKFRIETMVLSQIKSALNMSIFGNFFSNVLGSVASVLASLGIGLFSVIFISFFFIRDDKLFSRILCALTPDRHEANMQKALSEVSKLLSRYFIGLIVEMSCVGLIDFLGLWAIARLDFGSAVGIGFLAGLLNIIPYVGPLLGGALGTVIALIVRYCKIGAGVAALSGTGLAGVGFWGFLAILLCVFFAAQMIDNFILQPVIYSTSIKASPLEIFIVLLIAGSIGGVVGMLTAIPAYTVIRVIAGRFFLNVKAIRRLLDA